MIKKTKVEVFTENIFCPNCSTVLEQDNTILMSHPPQYSYFCNECDYSETSFKNYPLVSYKEIIVEDEELTKDKRIQEIMIRNELLMQKSTLCTNYIHDYFDEFGYKG